MKNLKTYELFGGSSITSSLISDIRNLRFDQYLNTKKLGYNLPCKAFYKERYEECDDIISGIDYILSEYRLDSDKRNVIVDLNKYTIKDLKNFAEEYSMNNCFIGSDDKNFNILYLFTTDEKYINRFKKLLYSNPTILIGKIIIGNES